MCGSATTHRTTFKHHSSNLWSQSGGGGGRGGLGQVSSQRFINQFVLSSGLYGASAYFGLATQQGRKQLQTAYNKCLQVVTGSTNSTPIATLQEVAGAPSLDIRITRQAYNPANIAKRHTNPSPSTYVLSMTVRQRIRKDKLTRRSWRRPHYQQYHCNHFPEVHCHGEKSTTYQSTICHV